MQWLNTWLRPLVMRWLNIPVTVEHRRFVFKGEPIEQFTQEHYEAWATIWQTVPGLYDVWYQALGEAIDKMSTLPAIDANHGERIRLCQRAVDLWANLQIATKSAKDLNALHAQRQREQETGRINSASQQVM